MARLQPIIRFVDALAAQQRIVLWLECTHKVGISALTVQAQPHGFLEELREAKHWLCPFCPDPPPREKTAREMWRDAGEP